LNISLSFCQTHEVESLVQNKSQTLSESELLHEAFNASPIQSVPFPTLAGITIQKKPFHTYTAQIIRNNIYKTCANLVEIIYRYEVMLVVADKPSKLSDLLAIPMGNYTSLKILSNSAPIMKHPLNHGDMDVRKAFFFFQNP
jgi:hypothetical protein